jgi:thiol-disulfide isomerase/thioredoxin
MIKNIVLAVLVIVIAGAITYGLNAFFKSEKGNFFILEEGKSIPDFTFQTLDNKRYNLSDFRGEPVIIHFWASWCAPCVAEFPELSAMAKNNDVTVIAVSTDRTEQAIERFAEKYVPDLPDNIIMVHDKDKTITQDRFSVFALPESFIVTPEGNLQTHIIGAYADWQKIEL